MAWLNRKAQLTHWYSRSFTNRLTALMMLVSVIAVSLLSLASMLIVYQVIADKEQELLKKDLTVATNRLRNELININALVLALSRNAQIVNGLSDGDQRLAYLKPLIEDSGLANLNDYQLSLRNYRGDIILSRLTDPTLPLPDAAVLLANARQDIASNAPSAHYYQVGRFTWISLSHVVSFPDSNDAQGLVTVELPVSGLLGSWLGYEHDPRSWILHANENALANALIGGDTKPLPAGDLVQALVLPAPLENLQLNLELLEPAQRASRALLILIPIFLVLALASLGLVWFLSVLLGRRFARPIIQLAQVAREVELTGVHQQEIALDSPDEIGQLARDFMTMLTQLTQLQNHLESAVDLRSARLATIFALSPDGFMQLDAHGVINFVNPAFTQLTGIERDQVLAHDWAHLRRLLSERLVDSEEVIAQAIPEKMILRLNTPSLKTIAVVCRVTERSEMILYWQDLTQIAQVDAMRSAFLAKAAHELRTPLTSILGFTELLQKDTATSDRQREMLAIMARQGASLLALVRDLLDLSRADAKAGTVARAQHQTLQSLPALTRLIVQEFKVPGDERKLVLSLGEHLPEVRIDANAYRQVMSNLLSNALKYSQRGTPILVSTCAMQKDGVQYLGVAIEDHGIGMSPVVLDKLGERFFRADPGGTVKGTGLGISVVQEIMTAHQGFIEFSSQPQVGTTVRIWFPIPT